MGFSYGKLQASKLPVSYRIFTDFFNSVLKWFEPRGNDDLKLHIVFFFCAELDGFPLAFFDLNFSKLSAEVISDVACTHISWLNPGSYHVSYSAQLMLLNIYHCISYCQLFHLLFLCKFFEENLKENLCFRESGLHSSIQVWVNSLHPTS